MLGKCWVVYHVLVGRLNFCPLGACVLAGTGLPIDRFMTSNALGFTAPMRNSIDAVSDRDFVLEILSTDSIGDVHLSRLGEEWVLWASEEFGFLTPNSYKCTEAVIIGMLVTTFLMILL
ncbi:hypothetical protein IFM89_002954 [Coptis chinensis]|uniref:Fumarate lyase N-terminal domain-containing protein n=1 Tax=Coptis chinensis TaxID=261450 RepID=A0A835IKP1_9MAGN|nr:hypothetical protein IFM89_002954 [Coptis chinensis]